MAEQDGAFCERQLDESSICGKPLPCPDHPPTAEQERARIVADLRAMERLASDIGDYEAAFHLERAADKYERGEHWKGRGDG